MPASMQAQAKGSLRRAKVKGAGTAQAKDVYDSATAAQSAKGQSKAEDGRKLLREAFGEPKSEAKFGASDSGLSRDIATRVQQALRRHPEAIEDAFQLIDMDDSGLIDFREFSEMLAQMGVQIHENRDEAYQLFRRFDLNDDGLITFPEFLNFAQGETKYEGAEEPVEDNSRQNETKSTRKQGIVKMDTFSESLKEGGVNWASGMEGMEGWITYNNGNTYDGEWKDGKRHGEGVMIFATGSEYKGQWANGQNHGEGVFTYVNGVKREGKWVRGKKHGKATLRKMNGDIYQEVWEHGVRMSKDKYTGPPDDGFGGTIDDNEDDEDDDNDDDDNDDEDDEDKDDEYVPLADYLNNDDDEDEDEDDDGGSEFVGALGQLLAQLNAGRGDEFSCSNWLEQRSFVIAARGDTGHYEPVQVLECPDKVSPMHEC